MPHVTREHRNGPVRVAGAGPAGLACAIELATRGVRCEIYERHPVIGGRFDGDHQILPSFGDPPWADQLLAELGVTHDGLECRPLRSARFLDDSGRVAHGHSESPFAWLVRRGPEPGSLDAAMARRAEDLGVRIHTGQPLALDRADVIATGLRRVDGLAVEEMFQTSCEDRTDVLLDEQLAPGGYAYLFVSHGEATLGIAALGAFRDLADRLDSARERFQDLAPFDQQNPRSAAHGMNFCLAGSAIEEGRPCVGEAAGFQDFLFGLGLRMAIVSGRLSAIAIAEDREYDELWSEARRGRMQTSMVDRWLYERGAVRRWLMGRMQTRDLQELLNDLQRHHWSKRLLLPWVRRFGSRPNGQSAKEARG
jgi:flavin-dependent dehydrogenase